MEFMMIKKFPISRPAYLDRRYLEDIRDEPKAISEAEQFARSDQGVLTITGLFARKDGKTVRAIRGWRKAASGMLKYQRPEDVECEFNVTSQTFDDTKLGRGDLEHLRRT